MNSASAIRSPLAVICFLGTASVGLLLDLWTKSLAVAHLKYQLGIEFIPGIIHFDYTENKGAVFGLGQVQQWLFVAVSVAALIFLMYLFIRSDRNWFYQIILGMLLAGVLGNMIDRISLGYVRDMIHAFPRWPNLFPYIFNVADMMLCTGVGLMLLYSFLAKPETPHSAEAQGEHDQQR
jgi:signal peptidase II